MNDDTRPEWVIIQLLEDIAKRHLGLTTLQTRNHDDLDFHEISVESIRTALKEAYNRGFHNGLTEG